ncbi:MAG: aconitate hydratase, partial [Desulfobacca sp.]|nr:aconitate hydratase [Desulfobacca sp.]
VVAKSFARIHLSNLINYGIIPLVFKNSKDYDHINQGDWLDFSELRKSLKKGLDIKIGTRLPKKEIVLRALVPEDKKEILLSGGLLPFLKSKKVKTTLNFEGRR